MALLCVVLVVALGIQALVCWLVSNCYKRIPQQFRLMEPNMVWLMMIPCFNLVWMFFVYPKLAKSYKAYFDSVGNTEVGDCGAGLSLAYPIVAACSIIPCVNYIAGPASLVLLIIVLVKAHGLKEKIPAGAGTAAPPSPAA
ncbi:MAG: hypothetical protein NTW87_05895 [Planctomycetota bacterium]|nr:hypothetical protein [Planctomycetota bacterium]